MPSGYEPHKILVFDIETTDFKANFGHMLLWAAKWVGEEGIYSARIDENPDYGTSTRSMIDDCRIVTELRDLVDQAQAVVYHYGDRFDLRFLNTRCLENGILPPAKVTSIDTWKIAKYNLAMTSNRLGVLSESFGNGEVKSHLSREDWKLASHGDKEVLDRMMEYCEQDVRSTEQVYLTLRPLVWNHPIIFPQETNTHCPACGSDNTHGNGKRATRCFVVYRQRCNVCGNNFTRERVKRAT